MTDPSTTSDARREHRADAPDAERLLPPDVASLVPLIDEQARTVSELVQLARRQRDFVESERSRPLMALLARRRELVTSLCALQDRIAACTQAAPDAFDRLPDDVRRTVRTQCEAVRTGLDEVQRRDEADQVALARRRADTTQELKRMDGAGRARQAYGQPNPVAPRFEDQQV